MKLDSLILQNILQYAIIGVHVIDKDKRTILYNKTMADLEGVSYDSVMNKDILEVFPSLTEDTSTLIKVLNTGLSILNKTQTYTNWKDQEITTINSTIPLEENGEIVGALEIANNITNIKDLSEQLIKLQRELQTTKLEISSIKGKIKEYRFRDIIGESENIKDVKKIALMSKNSASNVLIYGETGTGKELFAQSIHYEGNRSNMPFIAQNCAAIPEGLLEGILFGTSKGSFTGALDKEGLFEQANGGTLMLDEINSMPINLQAKLLRVLQEGYVRRLGGKRDIPINVKIIATTNENPQEAIKKGSLRSDLFYRLNVIYINIPPLKDRREDIPILADHFIKKYNKILGKSIVGISDNVLELFLDYNWPGNIRELENIIEGAMNMVLEKDKYLGKKDFMSSIGLIKNKEFKNISIFKEKGRPLPEVMGEVERDIIYSYLKRNNYNISKTAEELGIKRQTLQHKLKKYELVQ